MFELLVVAFLVFVACAVFGLFASLVAVIGSVVLLPFTLLGYVMKGLGVLLALPFMILFFVFGGVVFGFAALLFLAPALPIFLFAWGIWWLATRGRSRPRVTG